MILKKFTYFDRNENNTGITYIKNCKFFSKPKKEIESFGGNNPT